MTLKFEKTESPDPEDVGFILKQLRAYNRAQAGVHTEQKIAVYARNVTDKIVGGVTGEIHWGWLHVQMLWVDEVYRGQQIGSRLINDIEALAKQYNVVGFHVGTTDFQALDFYRKAGYEVWGQLPDFPPGHTNYELRKLNKG